MSDRDRRDGEHDDAKPETDRTVSQQAKQQPEEKPGKPDEGTRPDDLTSENDGGGEG